jgi:hypothetical protein
MQPISDREPAGMVVGSHASYRAARQDADRLVSHGFPPDRVSIRVRGLRMVRRRLPTDTSLRRVSGAPRVGAAGGGDRRPPRAVGSGCRARPPGRDRPGGGGQRRRGVGGRWGRARARGARPSGSMAGPGRREGAGGGRLRRRGRRPGRRGRPSPAVPGAPPRRRARLLHPPSNHPRSDPAPGTATEPSQRGHGSGRPRPGERRQAKARTSRTMTRASTATKIQNISHHRPATRSALGPNGSTGGGPRPQPASRPTVAPAKTSRRRARWRWLPGLAMFPSRAAGASRGASRPRDGRNGPPSFRCKTPGPDRLGVETV